MSRFLNILPWVVTMTGLCASYYFHSANKSKDAESAKLRPQAEEVVELKKENEELAKLPSHSDEIARLKKANADLLKLRNEARKIREENRQLATRLKNEIAKAQSAEAALRVQVAGTNAARFDLVKAQAYWDEARKLDGLQGEAKLKAFAEYTGTPEGKLKINAHFCITYLRQIDGAKQQWALENRKTAEAVPTSDEVGAFIRDGFPKCPAAGVYSINSIAADPTCSIPGHQLPQ